jgi:hypothetical protein
MVMTAMIRTNATSAATQARRSRRNDGSAGAGRWGIGSS